MHGKVCVQLYKKLQKFNAILPSRPFSTDQQRSCFSGSAVFSGSGWLCSEILFDLSLHFSNHSQAVYFQESTTLKNRCLNYESFVRYMVRSSFLQSMIFPFLCFKTVCVCVCIQVLVLICRGCRYTCVQSVYGGQRTALGISPQAPYTFCLRRASSLACNLVFHVGQMSWLISIPTS